MEMETLLNHVLQRKIFHYGLLRNNLERYMYIIMHNACTFIALLTGSAYVANASILHLPNSWFVVLAQYMVNGNNIYDAVTRQTPRMFGVNDAATLVKQTTGITKVSQEHQCDFDAPLQSAQLSNFVRK